MVATRQQRERHTSYIRAEQGERRRHVERATVGARHGNAARLSKTGLATRRTERRHATRLSAERGEGVGAWECTAERARSANQRTRRAYKCAWRAAERQGRAPECTRPSTGARSGRRVA